MEKIRSFIAIELPEEIKRELGQLQAKLRTDRPRLRWVEPGTIHLTLKFLGDIPLPSVEPVSRVLADCAAVVAPFRLALGRSGAFPNLNRPQVVWVGLGGDLDSVEKLHRLIETNLAPLGFAPENHPFSPHLTLGRVGDDASPDERSRLGELIAKAAFESHSAFTAKSLSLMKSQLTPRGAIHTRLFSAALKKS